MHPLKCPSPTCSFIFSISSLDIKSLPPSYLKSYVILFTPLPLSRLSLVVSIHLVYLFVGPSSSENSSFPVVFDRIKCLVWDFLNLNSVFSGSISISIIFCFGKGIEYIAIFWGFLNLISVFSGNISILIIFSLGKDIE